MERAQRPCPEPGCPQLVQGGGRCVEHKRPSGRAIYDAEFQALRAELLANEPMCRRCRRRRARVADHIWPIRAGGSRLDPDNLRPLCLSCHAIVTEEICYEAKERHGRGDN